MRKYLKFVLFISLFCLVGVGLFCFSNIWREDKTLKEDEISTTHNFKLLNSHSSPQTGEEWVVSFETEGTADLTIIPKDEDTVGDLDFISLTCNGEERTPQILEKDNIFYPNWECLGEAKLTHLVNIARKHTLKFQFGNRAAFAYNNPDSVTDTFSDESKIASKSNITVSGGQVKLKEWACGGTLTDLRDGKTYATVQIGTQCWMKQGLNVGTRVNGSAEQNNDSQIEKYCYGDDENNCASNNNPNYPDGGLYQWAEAMALAYSCNSSDCSGQIQSPHQGICPEGWHLPADDEFKTLEVYLGCTDQDNTGWRCSGVGTKLKPGGTSGFEGNLAGYQSYGNFYSRTSYGRFWSSSQYSTTHAWPRDLNSDDAKVARGGVNKAYGFSVRCLKD